MLSVRLFKFDAAHLESARGGSDSADAQHVGIQSLRDFRCFTQVMRRSTDSSAQAWWRDPLTRAPLALVCLRGDSLISRFNAFFLHEWKARG